MRQILIEALVLAMVGGALGLGLAFWGTQVLIHFMDKGAARTALSATPDMRVLLFTFATCIVTAALFGIAPAMRSSRTNVAGALNANARNSGGTSARHPRVVAEDADCDAGDALTGAADRCGAADADACRICVRRTWG